MGEFSLKLSELKSLRLFTFTISTPAGYSLPHSEPILESIQVVGRLYI